MIDGIVAYIAAGHGKFIIYVIISELCNFHPFIGYLHKYLH